MANAKAIFAQLEKDSCAASVKPTVSGGKPYVPRATKPVDAPPGAGATSQSSSASPHASLKPTTTSHSTDGSASPQSAKLKPASGTKPFGTAASAKLTESSSAKTGEKPSWAQQLKSTTPGGGSAGTAGSSPQLTKSTPKPAWSKPSPAATSSAETTSVGDNPFRKPLKSTTGSPSVTPAASASSEAKIAFGGRLKSVTPRSVDEAKSNDSSEDTENVSPSIAGTCSQAASNETKVPDATDDADPTSGRDSIKAPPRQRKPSNRLPGTGGALSPRVQQRSSPGLALSSTTNDAETQEPGAVETEKNGNDDDVRTQEERPSKDQEVHVNGKKDACDSKNSSANAKKQISSPPPNLPKRQPGGNAPEIKFSAPPAIPAARSNLSNSSAPAGILGKQPLAAPPAASAPADIVTDRQGRRYRRLPAPKANSGKPPRKLAKPPVVDLSQFKTAIDGIGRNNGDATAEEAGLADDDEVYTDATSSTPSKQPAAVIGGQYVTGFTRGGGASKPGPEVSVAGGQDDGEIYEEL